MIYLDSAATAFHRPPQVAEAVAAALGSFGNPARGGHAYALRAARTVYETRVRLAALFGCPRADHVAFTSNATEALNIAIYGVLAPGDRALTTDLEHNSVLRPLYDLQERGLELDFAPPDRQGRLDCAELERRLRPGTKAVVCTHASNLTGNPVDLERVAAAAHRAGALLIVDAAQTAGVLPIDMEAMGIDVLCFTGHKGLMGPQGTGGLCLRPGVQLRPFKRGGSGVRSYESDQPMDYPTRLEAGTLNAHGLAGLHAALGWLAEQGREKLYEKEHSRMLAFYEGVRGLPGVTVYGDFSQSLRPGIVSLNIGRLDSARAADLLAEDYGIAVRAGAHCAPRLHRAMGTEEQGAVRFSFSPFTTEEEVRLAVAAVRELAAENL